MRTPHGYGTKQWPPVTKLPKVPTSPAPGVSERRVEVLLAVRELQRLWNLTEEAR